MLYLLTIFYITYFMKLMNFLGTYRVKSNQDVLYIFYKLEFYLNLSLFRHYLN